MQFSSFFYSNCFLSSSWSIIFTSLFVMLILMSEMLILFNPVFSLHLLRNLWMSRGMTFLRYLIAGSLARGVLNMTFQSSPKNTHVPTTYSAFYTPISPSYLISSFYSSRAGIIQHMKPESDKIRAFLNFWLRMYSWTILLRKYFFGSYCA